MSERPPITSRVEVGSHPERAEHRRLLLELEATNLYLFHGSTTAGIAELEPRQAYTYISKGIRVKDGAPCVAATRFADAAIFRALVTEDATSFGQDQEGKLHLRASKKATELIAPVGYVYVFDRVQFAPRNGDVHDMEWRSDAPTKPKRVIPVTKDDLPDFVEELKPDEWPK